MNSNNYPNRISSGWWRETNLKNKQGSSRWIISSRIEVNIPKMCLKPTPWRCFSRYLCCILVAHHLWWRRFLALLPGVQHKERLATWPRGWTLSWLLVFVAGEVGLPPEWTWCLLENWKHWPLRGFLVGGMNFHQKCFFPNTARFEMVRHSGLL